MKSFLNLWIAFIALLMLSLTSCTQAQLSEGESAAYTAANALETVNTATGGGVTLLTQALVDKALKSTHNDGDTAVVNAAIAEGAAALKVQTAAAQAGLSPVAAQAATTAVLTDPAVIQTGAAAAAGPTGSPTTELQFHPRMDIRAVAGETNPYDVSVAGHPLPYRYGKVDREVATSAK